VAVFSFVIRTLLVVDPLQISDIFVMTYVASVFTLAALALYVGFLGGRLTFPYSSE